MPTQLCGAKTPLILPPIPLTKRATVLSYTPLTKGMISSQVVPKNPTFDPKMSRKTQTPSSTQATPNSKLGMD